MVKLKKLFCVIMIAMSMLFSSCSGTEEVICKTEFVKEEFIADYSQLWDDLYVNYPFFSILEKKGIDVEQIYLNGLMTIENEVDTIDDFVILLNSIFNQMNQFAHLSFVDVSLYDFLYDFYNTGYETSELSTERFKILSNMQTKAIYQYLKDAENRSTNNALNFPEVDMTYFEDINTAYFHFKTFDYSLIERDKNLINNYLLTLNNVDNIIIDITGNAGGATQYWNQVIVESLGGDYELEYCVYAKDSPVNKTLLSTCNFIPIEQNVNEVPTPDFVNKLGLTHYLICKESFSYPKTKWTNAKKWVLIDNRVFSSADQFAMFCEKSNWATLVGENTFGDGDGFESEYISLKNTGLLVRFSTTCIANSEGNLNCEYGTIPDITSPENERPIETCKRLIKKTNLRLNKSK